MKTSAVIAVAVLGSAAAFVPSVPLSGMKVSTVSRSSSKGMTMAAAREMVGTGAPLGFFDPLGFSKGSEDSINHYRECELKHGRIAMIATLGWFWQEVSHPLFPNVSGNPLKALVECPKESLVQIFAFIGFVEFISSKLRKQPDYIVGDYLGANQLMDEGDEGWKAYQTKELNNGRLAMMAIMGLIVQDILTGQGVREQMEAMMAK